MRLSVCTNMFMHGCTLLLLVLTACSKQASSPQTTITGNLSYATPMQFASGAQLQLHLWDVTGTDGAAVDVASITINDIASLPYHYTLPFDASRIDNTHHYTVDARLFLDGKLRFATDSPFTVLTTGSDRQRDIMLATAGENVATPVDSMSSANPEVFRGELRTDGETSLWSAGQQQGKLIWIEEDHGSSKGVIHARYDFKGGYVVRYRDSSPLEIEFDDHGKPVSVMRNQKSVTVADAMTQINVIRNRAALLRSQALASHETKQHRDETERVATAK